MTNSVLRRQTLIDVDNNNPNQPLDRLALFYPDGSKVDPSVLRSAVRKTVPAVRSMLTAAPSPVTLTLNGPLPGEGGNITPGEHPEFFRVGNTVPSLTNGFYSGYQYQMCWRVEYDFVGRKHRFPVYADSGDSSGSRVRAWMNERPGSWLTLPTDKSYPYVLVDAGAGNEGYNRFVLEFDGGAKDSGFPAFVGITKLPSDTLVAPSLPLGFKFMMVGDSFLFGARGSVGSGPAAGYAQILQRLLGTQNTVIDGWGGSGFVGGQVPYGHPIRLNLIDQFKPEVLVVKSTINDSNQPLSQVMTAFASWLDAARQRAPNAKIVCGGLMEMRPYTQSEIEMDDAFVTACAAEGIPYIKDRLANPPWFTGTGNKGEPAGDGNADVMLDADDIHPTADPGHVYMGYKTYAALGPILGL